ncbi:MAG: ATP-binding protein [Bacillota bacterium]|nr:ATP-binding protein [Bacillota bacterium]
MHEEYWKAWLSCRRDDRLLFLLKKIVGYLAHEINNPLTSILGYATLLLRVCNPCCMQRQELDLICREAIRARTVVWEFLSFVEQTEEDLRMVDLNELLRKVVEQLRSQINRGEIEFRECYCQDLPKIAVDATQMKSVFLHILNNAVEAIPGRGVVTVLTRARESDLEIEVRDSGTGIPVPLHSLIFHPFFTTKESSDKIGLGLTVSREVVRRHHGRLEFWSEAGKGTSFYIRLPIETGCDPLRKTGGGWF